MKYESLFDLFCAECPERHTYITEYERMHCSPCLNCKASEFADWLDSQNTEE